MAGNEYGRALREIRGRLDVSLRTFAKAVGIHATYLSKIELGQLPPPSLEVQRRIDNALQKFGGEVLRAKKRQLAYLQEDVFLLELQLIQNVVDQHLNDGERTDQLIEVLRRWIGTLEASRAGKDTR